MPNCPELTGTEEILVCEILVTLVFYFIIVFPKLFTGINSCSMWTHEGDKSAFSISHKEDKKMMLNYLLGKFLTEKKGMCLSPCAMFESILDFPFFSIYFSFPFPFLSLPFIFFYLFVVELLTLPPLLSFHPRLKLIDRKQTTGCMKWRLLFLLWLLRDNRQYKHHLITVFHLKGRNRFDNT